jgi:hypothetical protein
VGSQVGLMSIGSLVRSGFGVRVARAACAWTDARRRVLRADLCFASRILRMLHAVTSAFARSRERMARHSRDACNEWCGVGARRCVLECGELAVLGEGDLGEVSEVPWGPAIAPFSQLPTTRSASTGRPRADCKSELSHAVRPLPLHLNRANVRIRKWFDVDWQLGAR